MDSSEPEVVAKGDLPYVNKDLPLTFFGVKHTKWTKKDLVEIIETFGGNASTNTTKLELYETVHLRYNPERILQRTINALEVLAQAVAGHNWRSQVLVREAVQDATRERADLAREKRAAARQRGATRPAYEPEPVPQGRKNDGRSYLAYTWDLDEESEKGEGDPVPTRRMQPPATPKGTNRRKRAADGDLQDSSDVEIVRVVSKRAGVSVDSKDGEADKCGGRKRQAESTFDNGRAKRQNVHNNLGQEGRAQGPPPVAFGTSIAIRDNIAFGVGLQPVNYELSRERPSCQVCSDELDPLLQFQVTVASNCNHAPEICLACWEQHIVAQADTKSWDSISCPHADCGVILDYVDMQRFAPSDIFRRYDKYQMNKTLQSAPEFRLCAHEGCKSGGFVEGYDLASEYITCADCQRNTCLGCNLIHHDGQTCEEYRVWLADAPRRAEVDRAEKARMEKLKRAEEKSAKYLDRRAKTCPNAKCGAVIQKTSGCDHMICLACRHEFCWVCFADYKTILREGNQRHAAKCHYYSGGIPGHR